MNFRTGTSECSPTSPTSESFAEGAPATSASIRPTASTRGRFRSNPVSQPVRHSAPSPQLLARSHLRHRHTGFEAQTTLDSAALSDKVLRHVNHAVDQSIGNDIAFKSLPHESEVECSRSEDQSLSLVLNAWPKLSPTLRAAVLAIVRSVCHGSQ